ncbi:MAG: NAD(P)H-binding protein [Eubacteriales bacterium]|nr:NAD(P)H-binding protein [Eubacteriales bacterium]
MKILIVGGTGFLGYHAVLVGLKRGHKLDALAIDDIELGGWYPKEVVVHIGNVFELSEEELQKLFSGFDAVVYAVGPDDRIVPPAPAYDFFHARLVVNCEKTITAARKAGVKRCVVLGSYFAYFDRLWPDKMLCQRHPYIRCRVEQAERAIAAGKDQMSVMILELPYIFGSMPGRVPLWKDVLLDRYIHSRVIFFPKGGTNMIAAEHIGEAIIGALENGEHGKRYPIGDENHSYHEMLEMMMAALGTPKKIVNVPRFMAVIAGIMIDKKHRKNGLESGLNAKYLMRGIQTHDLYFDPSDSVKALGYHRGGLKQSIIDTMKACYPEKFTE